MAKEIASVQLTGGAGFDYEDHVAAFFAAAMLAQAQPFGPGFGGVSQIDWQVRDQGWLLDDLVVKLLRPAGGAIALSVKSDRQVTGVGFPETFVALAWEQWLGLGTPNRHFDRQKDLLGLVVGELAEGPREAWNELLRQALRTAPERLAARYTTEGMANAEGRTLFASLRRPASVAANGARSDVEVAELVRRLRLLHLDFTSPTSARLGHALAMCRQAMKAGDAEGAERLWGLLLPLCASRRTAGGTLTPADLITAVRDHILLRDHPDRSLDWSRLGRRAVELSNRIRTTVGKTIELDRSPLVAELRERLMDASAVLVLGSGGSGKSALVKEAVSDVGWCSRFVWLDAEAVDGRTLGEVEAHLGLATPLKTLFAESSASLSALVLDGLDRFSPDSLRTVAELLQAISEPRSSSGWVIVGTARADSAQQVAAGLRQSGLEADYFGKWFLDLPASTTVASTLLKVTQLAHLASRPSLLAMLRNLKVLDWVVGLAETATDNPREWVGYVDALDWVWSGWIGAGSEQLARGSVLKKLGEYEASHLARGVGISDLAVGTAGTLGELMNIGLVRVSEERVYFTHDLVGDVARMRVLVEKLPERSDTLVDAANAPRWHPAIRLFGQRLAEHTSDETREWKRVFGMFDDVTPQGALVRNLLMEGVALSVNAGQLIESLWQDLMAEDGLLLNRLLRSFRYVATVPDPRIARMSLDESDRAEFEAGLRMPLWPLWPPVLEVLAAHASDVARVATGEAAGAVGLWLRTMPTGSPGCVHAARVALAVGHELQEAGAEYVGRDGVDEVAVHEAVLSAAAELPDDVAQFALEMARRRAEPLRVEKRRRDLEAEAEKQAAAWREKRPASRKSPAPSLFSEEFGEEVPQQADGPAESVDRSFRSAMLRGTAVCTLAQARPEAAREALLACCLQPPHRRHYLGSSLSMDRLGVTDPERLPPPFYSNGPWLSLLAQNPALGIECIVRLVNQATANWAVGENIRHSDGAPLRTPTVKVELAGSDQEWQGDLRVFGWYRDRLIHSHTLVSALMALERWLYIQVDAGRSVDGAVQRLFSQSRSVAVLGVLSALAVRNPELVAGPLLPLLGVWQLDDWTFKMQGDHDVWRIGMVQWYPHGERQYNTVVEWNTLPHRGKAVRECFQALLLTRPDMRGRFAHIRERWLAEASTSASNEPWLRRLAALYDIGNWKATNRPEGGILLAFEWPDALKQETSEIALRSQTSAEFLSFPIRCRMLLDAGQPLADDAAQGLWDALRRLEAFEYKSPNEEKWGPGRRREDVVAGGVAALQVLAPEWVRQDLERLKWCRESVEAIRKTPPSPSMFEVPESVSTDEWHSFLAELAISDLAEKPDDPNRRGWAANAVMSRWYATTRLSMARAARLRSALGDDFRRLANVCVLWAAIRAIRTYGEDSENDHSRFAARCDRLIWAFVQERVPAATLDWKRVGAIACRSRDRLRNRRFRPSQERVAESFSQRMVRLWSSVVNWGRRAWGLVSGGTRTYTNSKPLDGAVDGTTPLPVETHRRKLAVVPPGFDCEVLSAAFSWLSDGAGSLPTDGQWERETLGCLLAVSLGMLSNCSADPELDVDGGPYDFDLWVFERVAQAVARLRADEEPERLWRPILELPNSAHYWVESFLSGFIVHGPAHAPSPEAFFDRWREMVAFAETSPAWNPASDGERFHHSELWKRLLGIDFGGAGIAVEANATLLGLMSGSYERWAKKGLRHSWDMRDFCVFLTKPGARNLRLPAVRWLASSIGAISEARRERDGIDDRIVRVLRIVWAESSGEIAGDAALRKDFLELLGVLSAAQGEEALHLRDQVVKTLGAS